MAARERFADNLRRERHRRGLTQEQLGHACGLHPTEVSRLERGIRDPRLTTIARLAAGLDVTPARLVRSVR